MTTTAPVLSIVLPIYNEEEILAENLQRIHNYLADKNIQHEIIAVSNASTDKTTEIGELLSKKFDWLNFIHIQEQGVGLAFRKGCLCARGEIIVSLDADLPSDMQFLEFAHQLQDSYDLLIGSKFMGFQQRGLLRLFGSQLYVLLSQFFFALTVSDYSPDSKAFRREFIVPILENLDPWTGYVLEAALFARLNKLRIVQVSIDTEDKRPSSFNLFYEGYYRYTHFFRTWFLLRNSSSWFHADKACALNKT